MIDLVRKGYADTHGPRTQTSIAQCSLSVSLLRCLPSSVRCFRTSCFVLCSLFRFGLFVLSSILLINFVFIRIKEPWPETTDRTTGSLKKTKYRNALQQVKIWRLEFQERLFLIGKWGRLARHAGIISQKSVITILRRYTFYSYHITLYQELYG